MTDKPKLSRQAMCDRLAMEFQDDWIVNLGVGGYGTLQSARRLAQYLREHPDAVVRSVIFIHSQNDITGFWGSAFWRNWETRYAHATGMISRNNVIDYVVRLQTGNTNCPIQSGNHWQGCGVTSKSSSDVTATDNWIRSAQSGGIQLSHQGFRQGSQNGPNDSGSGGVGMRRAKTGAERWYDCRRNIFAFNTIVFTSLPSGINPKMAGWYYNTSQYGESPTQTVNQFFNNAGRLNDMQDNEYIKEPGAPNTRFLFRGNTNFPASSWQNNEGFDSGVVIP